MFNSEPIQRTPEAQSEVDSICQNLKLYQFQGCPFCMRVRATLRRLALPIELRDTMRDPQYRQELIDGGGRSMVPCLRIATDANHYRWVYESADIVAYLEAQFGGATD